MKMCFEVLKTNPSFARAVEWLLKRLKSGFDWTVPLHVEQLFSAAYMKYKLSIPCCLLSVCEDSGDKWMTNKDLIFGAEDVFTVLFEYCRVSDSALQWILKSLIPNKLTSGFQDIRRRVLTSLAQILPHCTWKEWKRILEMCRHLIRTNILKADSTESVPCVQTKASNQDVYQLSVLLLDMVEVLHSPLCSAWATPYVWLYVIRHYITAIKEIVDGNTDAAVTASVFAHVCHVMTFVPADCMDQLFVLALDLVARPSVSNSDVSERMKRSINRLSSEVHRAALTQKLNQNM
ncbi:Gem (nuclear organelle) associated protein 4 [Desmophyllum pertusum]|uniref:Gem (Nuclear organelle) associated protein 4 n=1 Tax=Desmophyllum pertusum TaxID=174260 RepID=A0A9X0CGJ4_9CNID|nr:Gem (nuclear organelle) associated protein 4 [Desmophyllum pertusum]